MLYSARYRSKCVLFLVYSHLHPTCQRTKSLSKWSCLYFLSFKDLFVYFNSRGKKYILSTGPLLMKRFQQLELGQGEARTLCRLPMLIIWAQILEPSSATSQVHSGLEADSNQNFKIRFRHSKQNLNLQLTPEHLSLHCLQNM